jgi:hypothetical protein
VVHYAIASLAYIHVLSGNKLSFNLQQKRMGSSTWSGRILYFLFLCILVIHHLIKPLFLEQHKSHAYY